MKSVQQAVDALNEQLVARAEKIVQALGPRDENQQDVSKSQLARAIDVARAAQSAAVFQNWLAYQAGRKESGAFWTTRAGDRELIRWVEGTLGWIKKEIDAQQLGDAAVRRQAVTEALVRFLGFLRRAFVGAKFVLERGKER